MALTSPKSGENWFWVGKGDLGIPPKRFFKFKRYLRDQGFAGIEVQVRDSYTWSKTDSNEPIVQKMLHSYRLHGLEPETWPIATWADPYFVSSGILSLPVVSGGVGHGGRQHVANEYMAIKGLRDFEMSIATFLYLMANKSDYFEIR